MKKAIEIKNDSSGKSGGSAKKQKPKKSGKNQKKSKERLKGRDFYFGSDGIPKILLNNVVASGYEYGKEQNVETLIFKCVATDISSDQNVCGKPAKIEAGFKIFGDNKASVAVDARTNSESPLVVADYSGKNYPFSADAHSRRLSAAGLQCAGRRAGSPSSARAPDIRCRSPLQSRGSGLCAR